MSEVRTIHECVSLLLDMIEEVQNEAARCALTDEWHVLIAKRDALTELRLRIRGEQPDPRWVHRVQRRAPIPPPPTLRNH